MDPMEVSRLLYLADAVTSAPGKAPELLRIAAVGAISDRYKSELEKLNVVAGEPKKVLEASATLKQSLGS